MQLYAWLLYSILCIVFYYWLLSSVQILAIAQLGAYILFFRKVGVYLIRITNCATTKCQNLLQHLQHRKI